ncbi:MAG: hypothetical protein ACYDA6_07070 [Solirubrobacteraceae bacterium]
MRRVIRGRIVALCGVIVLAPGLASCGATTGTSARSVVQAMRVADRQMASGQLDLSLRISASRGSVAGSPLALRVSGPFESRGAHLLPQFDLTAALAGSGAGFKASATLTGSGLYIGLGGQSYEAPPEVFAALRSSYEAAARAAGAGSGGAPLGVLGADPSEWLTDPVDLGEEHLEGIAVRHIRARLQASRLMAAAGRLSGLSGMLGGLAGSLPGASSLAALLSGSGRSALARSIRSATVDIYTGASDHILRGIDAKVQVAASGASSAALGGLTTATMEVTLRIAALNRPQRIEAPGSPHPFSQLVGEVGQSGTAGRG